MNEILVIYTRQRVAGDFKMLLIRSLHMLGESRDFVSAERFTVGVIHTESPHYFP